MTPIIEAIYVLCAFILVSGFYILLQPFIKSMIRGIIIQSVLLGLVSFVMFYITQSIDFVVLGLLIIFLRGFLVSYVLERRIPKRKELFREATTGMSSTFLTALMFSTAGLFVVYFYVFSGLVKTVTVGTSSIIVFPFVMLFVGIYLFLSRKNTLAHVVGYVEEENSLVLMSIFLVPVPFIVELTVFMDVIALVMIASVVAREKTEHVALQELRG